jgi:hypothetical protein
MDTDTFEPGVVEFGFGLVGFLAGFFLGGVGIFLIFIQLTT